MKRTTFTVLYMEPSQLKTLADPRYVFAGLAVKPLKDEPIPNWIHIPQMACGWMGAWGEQTIWHSQLKINAFVFEVFNLWTLAALRGLCGYKTKEEMEVWNRSVIDRLTMSSLVTPPTTIAKCAIGPDEDQTTINWLTSTEREKVQQTLFALDNLARECSLKFQVNSVIPTSALNELMEAITDIFTNEEIRKRRCREHVLLLAEANDATLLAEHKHVIFREHDSNDHAKYKMLRGQNSTIYSELPPEGPFFERLPSGRIWSLSDRKILVEFFSNDKVRVSTTGVVGSRSYWSVRKAVRHVFGDSATLLKGDGDSVTFTWSGNTNEVLNEDKQTVIDPQFSQLIELLTSFKIAPPKTDTTESHKYALYVDGTKARVSADKVKSPFIHALVDEANIKQWAWNPHTEMWTMNLVEELKNLPAEQNGESFNG